MFPVAAPALLPFAWGAASDSAATGNIEQGATNSSAGAASTVTVRAWAIADQSIGRWSWSGSWS